MFSMSLKPPPSLDDMVALPPFIDPDAPKGKEEKAMRERSMARTKSLAAMPGKDTSVFQSKGWDALFQAAQDVSGLKALVEEEEAAAAAAEGVAAGFSEVSHETPWRNNTKSTAANKANKVKRPRGMEELYLLLDETPEETAEREKRLRERRETLLALRGEERKKWMSKHGRVVRPTLDDAMKLQLRQAFDLIDQDGSGAIDVDELEEAFKVLGIKVGRREVEEMMDEVDEDKSGEVELPEFEQIMTKQIMADPDTKGTGTGGAVPFHVIATSYRRKRLLDAIISGDKQAAASMIEKAELYRELEEAAQEGQRGDYFWITTKVAFLIRGWIRRWKAKKIAEMHRRKIGFVDEEFGSQKDIPPPPPPPPQVVFETGGRDMGLRVGEREIDNRTMEKIRMRAKLASIVNVFDTHDQLDVQSNSTDKTNERRDLMSIQGDLRNIITSRVADHKRGLEKRMLLAATAQNRMRTHSSSRFSLISRDSYKMAPSDIRHDLDLSPREQGIASFVERLSQLPKGGKNMRAVAKAGKTFRAAADRHAVSSKLATMLPEIPSVEGRSASSRKSHDGSPSPLPTRSSSCVPFSEFSDDGKSDDDDVDERSARLEKRRAKLKAVKLHGSKKEEDPRWMARASDAASRDILNMKRSASDLGNDNMKNEASKTAQDTAKSQQTQPAVEENRAGMPDRIAEEDEEEEGGGHGVMDEEVRDIMEGAKRRHRTMGHPIEGMARRPHTMPTPDVRVATRYLPIYQHNLAQAGAQRGRNAYQRSSPVPSSLTGLIPGAVFHSHATSKQDGIPSVQQHSQTLSALPTRRGASPAPRKRSGTASKPHRQQPRRSISPSAQRCLQLQEKAGTPKTAGPTNGVRPSTWRSSRSPAAHSPTPAIYPTYVPGKSGAHAVRSISPAPARQFLAVMRQSMPHTPNAPFHRSHGLELESTFLTRAEF